MMHGDRCLEVPQLYRDTQSWRGTACCSHSSMLQRRWAWHAGNLPVWPQTKRGTVLKRQLCVAGLSMLKFTSRSDRTSVTCHVLCTVWHQCSGLPAQGDAIRLHILLPPR
jgi:hypothetical protein